MPRFNYDVPAIQDPETSVKQKYGADLVEPGYDHSVVSSNKTDLSSLLTVIEGSSYNVDYYSQILGLDEEPRVYDESQSKAQQQYQLIHNYDLKLQGELEDVIDPADGRLTLTGTAITYPYLKPNVGDMFIGDIGDGKAGMFGITEVQKRTRFEQTVYEIRFALNREMTKEDEVGINSKVVKETHFVKDYIKFGQDPVLVDERFTKAKELNETIGNCLNEYLSEFYSFEHDTLLVPSGNHSVYDPFIAKLVLTLFDTDEHPLLRKISLLNTDDARFERYLNIWDVLIEANVHALDLCFNKVNVLPARSFSRNVFLQTIAFSGIDLVVMPVTNNVAIDDVLGLSETPAVPVNISDSMSGANVVNNSTQSESGLSVPDVEDTLGYVFNTAFYETTKESEEQTDFENLVKSYLNREHLDYRNLLKFYGDRDNWSKFQRFYLLPVLLILMIYEHRSL